MKTITHSRIDGTLVTLNLPGGNPRNLDGFWVRGNRKNRRLLIFVHGMGSNFYKSKFKKAWMQLAPRNGIDVFAFNNRGSEGGVNDERFTGCLTDIDAAMRFARAEGYQQIILLGHSTGCQKITYYYHRRKPKNVKALILTAVGDDLAIARRDLGRYYTRWITRARQLVRTGKGDVRLPSCCLNFSARRFLSAAAPGSVEANLFRFDGGLRIFRRLELPILAVFPEKEQYACIPVQQMAAKLLEVSMSPALHSAIIPDADHSFHGQEERCVKTCLRWIKKLR